MRGQQPVQAVMFSYVGLEERVPKDHPLRVIKKLTDGILGKLSPRLDALYAETGRPSIPPEQLLRALLIQILYTVRSERLLVEQLDYNLLFRWFVGLEMDAPVWHPTTFSQNRRRLLEGDVARAFFEEVVREMRTRGLLSDEHFTVDGTLLEACASQKSFRPKGEPKAPEEGSRNPEVNFRGQRRSNATHESTTDPDARLAKKGRGREAKLSYSGSVLMDNRHGLVVDAQVLPADGGAEVNAAVAMLARQPKRRRRRTVGADKLYDSRAFVAAARWLGFTPHVAQNTRGRRSAIDARTTRHRGYQVSQGKRKMIEQVYGWKKDIGLLRKLKHRGAGLIDWIWTFTAAAYDLVRMRNLILAGVCPL